MKEKKVTKKKDISVVSKILSVVFAVAVYIGTLIFTKQLPQGPAVDGIIKMASYIMLPFVTIDLAVIGTSIVKAIKGE
jgi:hypothetical protein